MDTRVLKTTKNLSVKMLSNIIIQKPTNSAITAVRKDTISLNVDYPHQLKETTKDVLIAVNSATISLIFICPCQHHNSIERHNDTKCHNNDDRRRIWCVMDAENLAT